MKSTKIWLAVATVAAIVGGGARDGQALEYDSSKSPHEITMKLYLDGWDKNKTEWDTKQKELKTVFSNARDIVFNYTHGQASVKRIEVYPMNPDACDITVKTDNSWPKSGVYMQASHPQVKLPYNYTASMGPIARSIAHEFGHCIFGVFDDYRIYCTKSGNFLTVKESEIPKFAPGTGTETDYDVFYNLSPSFSKFQFFGNKAQNNPYPEYKDCAYTWEVSQSDGPHTIMNNHAAWTEMGTPNGGRKPNTWNNNEHFGLWHGTITLGSFEKEDGSKYSMLYKDVQFETDQEHFEHKSAWETMQEKRGLVFDDKQKNDKQPDFEWVLMDGAPVIIPVEDSSGSMASGNKMAEALSAAQRAVGQAWLARAPFEGDYVGAIMFDSSPRTLVSPIEMTNKTIRSFVQSKITGYASGGTYINAALQHALGDLKGLRAEATGPECIILLSDGVSQDTVTDATLRSLKERGVKVNTVAYGSDADRVLLSRIARATGGKTGSIVPTWGTSKSTGKQLKSLLATMNLSRFFADLYAEGRESEQMTQLEGVASGEMVEQEILVDSFGDIDLTVNLYWAKGDMDLALVRPDGTVIERTAAEAAEADLDGGKMSDSAFIRVSEPETGTWKVRVTPAAGSGDQAYLTTVSCTGRDNMRMYAAASGDSLTWPAPLVVSASFGGAVPAITGATVTAVATCPDGMEVPFELNDNGVNGDEKAGDGVYAAEFKDFTEDGEYRFDVEGKNVSGKTSWQGYSPAEGGELPEPEPVEPFVRRKSLTVQYDGLPEFINATRYTGTEFASWTLNRNTGAMTGSLVVSNQPTSRKTLIAPFWYAVTETVNVTLAKVDGYTDDGDPYVNITDKVEAALMAKYGRKSMAPGEWVAIDGVEVYSRDRSIPDMTALWSLWADPPAGAERRIDSYDRDSDGVLDDEEILLAVEHWEALDMDDEALLKRIALWKQGEE